jgi:ectoine hydroxylase-related dioxygenase (phytanoyl-CoA dioxygenase family)
MWQPYRRLGPIIDCLLGGPHALMPNLWAWHVDPAKGEAGWVPHRDRRIVTMTADLRPMAVTIWIPLTAATPLNGCMYVLPKHRDKRYGDPNADGFECDLNDIRAVPASPGDSLVWTQELIHWGSKTSDLTTAPRLSMSVEFQRLDEPAFSDFVVPAEQHLTFEQKLSLVGRAISKYQHMHPTGAEMTEAALRWRDRTPQVF